MSLLEVVNTTITNILTDEFSEFLSDHLGTDKEEITIIVKKYLGNMSKPVSPLIDRKQPKSQLPIKNISSTTKFCAFVITRGNQSGEKCTTHVRGPGDYCSKHKNRKIKN